MDGYVNVMCGRKPFNSWTNPTSKRTLKLVSELIKPGSRVLNFGCGSNKLDYLDVKHVGYDIDRNNQYADYYDLKDIPGHFDYAYLHLVVEHMNPDDLNLAAKRLFPLADQVVITTPNIFDMGTMLEFYDDVTHVRPYITSDLENIFLSAGYNGCKAYLTDRNFSWMVALRARLSGRKPYHCLVIHIWK